MGEQRNKKVSEEEALKEAEKTLNELKGKKTQDGHAKIEEPKEEKKDKKESLDDTRDKEKKVEKGPKYRSKKYLNARSIIDRNKYYPINEALDLVKKTSYSKFAGSVELHIRLELSKKKESVRGLIQLPHGTGKELKAGVIDDKMIEEIIKNKKTDYDILLATPQMMPKIARIAKILGPQGKMPNPKSGTVTATPEKSLEEIKKGKSEYKADKQGIIHLLIGKTSWENNKLVENYKTVMTSLIGQKLQTVTACATMGPGIKIAL